MLFVFVWSVLLATVVAYPQFSVLENGQQFVEERRPCACQLARLQNGGAYGSPQPPPFSESYPRYVQTVGQGPSPFLLNVEESPSNGQFSGQLVRRYLRNVRSTVEAAAAAAPSSLLANVQWSQSAPAKQEIIGLAPPSQADSARVVRSAVGSRSNAGPRYGARGIRSARQAVAPAQYIDADAVEAIVREVRSAFVRPGAEVQLLSQPGVRVSSAKENDAVAASDEDAAVDGSPHVLGMYVSRMRSSFSLLDDDKHANVASKVDGEKEQQNAKPKILAEDQAVAEYLQRVLSQQLTWMLRQEQLAEAELWRKYGAEAHKHPEETTLTGKFESSATTKQQPTGFVTTSTSESINFETTRPYVETTRSAFVGSSRVPETVTVSKGCGVDRGKAEETTRGDSVPTTTL